MYKKVFLDANIFIDKEDETRDLDKNSLKVLSSLLSNDVELFTSCDLITTIYYILAKKDKQKALEAIENINKICKIIDFTNIEVNQTCALMKENPKFKDLEDTIQYILAKKEGCNLIISNDKEFACDEIELVTTKEFLEKI
ncbi:MAG: PIN domain-containing protein [Arcobacteraceae bacterium]|nr:PIN domain-containing protein [Arcobacteraceae bacterium]